MGGAQRVATTPLVIYLAEYDMHQVEMPVYRAQFAEANDVKVRR